MGKKTLSSLTAYCSALELKAIKTLAGKNDLTVSNYVRLKLGFDRIERGRKSVGENMEETTVVSQKGSTSAVGSKGVSVSIKSIGQPSLFGDEEGRED